MMGALLAASRAHCPSGKLTFWKRSAAEKAVRRAQERGEVGRLKVYSCPDCGHFHLTSGKRPRLSALNQGGTDA